MTGFARIALLSVVLALPQTPALPQAPIPLGSDGGGQLLQDVTTLSASDFEGREAGAPGGLRARRWIAEQFSRIKGLSPMSGTSFEQPFSFEGRAVANVVGRLAGINADPRVIVLTAHFDHLGVRNGRVYHGADDNASGVAALLAVARHFSARPPRHAIVFAALDAEEQGQRGAHALLGWQAFPQRQVALNVNLDMLSRSARNEFFVAGTSYTPWLRDALRPVEMRSQVRLRFGHDQPKSLGGQEDWTHASDHGPFHDAGIPFVYFGVEDHEDYHKPSDTADRVDGRFFAAVVRTVIDAVTVLDEGIARLAPI